MKVCFVTGGSKGIGKEIAKEFLNNGYAVVSTYNNTCPDENTGIDYVKCNLKNIDDIKKISDYIIKKYQRLDVLVNNAGVSKTGLVQDYTKCDFDDIFSVNVKAVYELCRFFVPVMVSQKSGSIVNVSSVWGNVGASCETLYSASKGAVNTFTKALAKELAPSNITVNAVCPGVIKTDMLNCYSQDELKVLANETPLMRLGEPKDISKAVYFLSQSDFITGQILTVDGGFTL